MPLGDPSFTDRGRAESFGSVAADYDRYRPTYPAALIDDLVAFGPRSVVDVGCGTGKAAVLLAARGLDVLGVEIDPKMAERAREHGITVEVSSFEDWDATGRTFDLLTSGQAWHWVDPSHGVPKAGEVLRPGGFAALFWNDDELDQDVHAALDEVYREHAPELLRAPVPNWRLRDDRPHAAPFESSPAFDAVETRFYEWQREFTADEWVGMCLTHSDHLLLPSDRREALARSAFALLERRGGLTAHYMTYLVLARRVG
jgi:SAM-dependent methyltransferase